MIVLNDSFSTKFDFETYITIGSFDGLHRGHLTLINKAISLSKENNAKSMVYTFKEHPLNIINKSLVPKILMDNETKIEILNKLGLDVLNLCNFDEQIMKMQPEEYILNMIRHYNLKGIITGFNHRFGYKNQGNVELLRALSEKYKFELYVVEPVKFMGETISSTTIRKYIAEGNVSKANNFLLRPFSLKGKVKHGRQIGRTMNFPTANLAYNEEFVVPGRGVYYTIAEYKDTKYKGITNVGLNPTVGGNKLSIETYILNFDENIYGEDLKIDFMAKIRDEVKFNSIDELKNQLKKDKHFAETMDEIK